MGNPFDPLGQFLTLLADLIPRIFLFFLLIFVVIGFFNGSRRPKRGPPPMDWTPPPPEPPPQENSPPPPRDVPPANGWTPPPRTRSGPPPPKDAPPIVDWTPSESHPPVSKPRTVSEVKGEEGEQLIRRKLQLICDSKYILSNVYLCSGKRSTEIDLLMLTGKYLYVFEVKNYSGKIYGAYNKKEWSQYLLGTEYKFYNPVWQNKGHCTAISKQLPYFPRGRILSVVVFCGNPTLKVYADNVTDSYDLLSFIGKLEGQQIKEFDAFYRQRIMDDLSSRVIKDPAVKRRHIEYVHEAREQEFHERL